MLLKTLLLFFLKMKVNTVMPAVFGVSSSMRYRNSEKTTEL